MAAFGSNPTYLYGQIYRNKFSTPDKSYDIEPLPVNCSSCPARLTDGSVEILFFGPIFNTYVISEEEHVSILYSADGKLTTCKSKVPRNTLVTVQITAEDEEAREVEMYPFDGIFPGMKGSGKMELADTGPHITVNGIRGTLLLQNNKPQPVTDCLLYKIANNRYYFVEVNNPVERCTVTVVKDLRTTKIVEHGSVKGVLVGCRSSASEYDVYAKRVLLGSYVFVEDIKEGPATVSVVEYSSRQGVTKVAYGDFIGEYHARPTGKMMKGVITDIKGNTFKFSRKREDESDSTASDKENRALDKNQAPDKTDASRPLPAAQPDPAAERLPPGHRTRDFKELIITKPMRIDSEGDIGHDEFRAIDFIRNRMDVCTNVLPLFNKYINILSDRDNLCLFYLHHLNDRGLLTMPELTRVSRLASRNFFKQLVETFDEPSVLGYIYSKKRSKPCFVKLLELSEDKTAFLREHSTDYTDYTIEYIYNNIPNPRVLVESLIDKSYRSWTVYLRCESGDYKRGLFRRLIQFSLKREEAKNVFKLWMEFEEQEGGDVEGVRKQAEAYITRMADASQ